jgi:hypothetical protein
MLNIAFVKKQGVADGVFGYERFNLLAVTPDRIDLETGHIYSEYHLLTDDGYTTVNHSDWAEMVEDYESETKLSGAA